MHVLHVYFQFYYFKTFNCLIITLDPLGHFTNENYIKQSSQLGMF